MSGTPDQQPEPLLTPDQLARIQELAKLNRTQSMVRFQLRLSPEQVATPEFREAHWRGRLEAEEKVLGRLYELAVRDGDEQALRAYGKMMMRSQEELDELDGITRAQSWPCGPDGKPVDVVTSVEAMWSEFAPLFARSLLAGEDESTMRQRMGDEYYEHTLSVAARVTEAEKQMQQEAAARAVEGGAAE